jgi:hypothetical protein
METVGGLVDYRIAFHLVLFKALLLTLLIISGRSARIACTYVPQEIHEFVADYELSLTIFMVNVIKAVSK